MSFAIIIEPIKVIYISATVAVRRFPVKEMIFSAKIVKNLIFLNAHITASVQKRHVMVFKLKYSGYCASGGMIIEVIIAATAAIQRTVFF